MATTIAEALSPARHYPQLDALNLEAEVAKEHESIKATHNQRFLDIIGFDTICSIPVVDPNDFDLTFSNGYPCAHITPSMLKNNSVVRGLFGERPFYAFKIERLDPQTHKVHDTVVEILFKRYAREGDFHDNVWRTVDVKNDKNQGSSSSLNDNGDIVSDFKKLLNGEEIKPRSELIRLAKA